MLFKEYETYIKDIFGSVEVQGPPMASKDPRPEEASCLEKTVRNKIKKMTYLHVYFKVSLPKHRGPEQEECLTNYIKLEVLHHQGG